MFFAEVGETLDGDGQDWDVVAVVNDPSRRSSMERQDRPDSLERHAHKAAGMERTIIRCCTPMELPIAATGVPVVVNLDAASPSTPGDP